MRHPYHPPDPHQSSRTIVEEGWKDCETQRSEGDWRGSVFWAGALMHKICIRSSQSLLAWCREGLMMRGGTVDGFWEEGESVFLMVMATGS